jgi:hypothetical protein
VFTAYRGPLTVSEDCPGVSGSMKWVLQIAAIAAAAAKSHHAAAESGYTEVSTCICKRLTPHPQSLKSCGFRPMVWTSITRITTLYKGDTHSNECYFAIMLLQVKCCRPAVHRSFAGWLRCGNKLEKEFRESGSGYFATDGQYASLSWCQAPIWHDQIFISWTFAVFMLMGVLSDERAGL